MGGGLNVEKIKDCLERNSELVTQIIEDPDTYKIEDIAALTDLNCRIAEVLLKIEGAKNGTVRTSKTSSKSNKK